MDDGNNSSPKRGREIRSHRDLIVWQRSMELAEAVYALTHVLPKHELYGLSSQLQRSAASVPVNIAEGFARGSRREYARFINISRGSLCELDTLLELSERVKFLNATQTQDARSIMDEVGKMLGSLRKRLGETDS